MREPGLIRTSVSLAAIALSAASCLACAKGTEISPTEVVILPVLPPETPDGGVADAGSTPDAPPADEQVSSDSEL